MKQSFCCLAKYITHNNKLNLCSYTYFDLIKKIFFIDFYLFTTSQHFFGRFSDLYRLLCFEMCEYLHHFISTHRHTFKHICEACVHRIVRRVFVYNLIRKIQSQKKKFAFVDRYRRYINLEMWKMRNS